MTSDAQFDKASNAGQVIFTLLSADPQDGHHVRAGADLLHNLHLLDQVVHLLLGAVLLKNWIILEFSSLIYYSHSLKLWPGKLHAQYALCAEFAISCARLQASRQCKFNIWSKLKMSCYFLFLIFSI